MKNFLQMLFCSIIYLVMTIINPIKSFKSLIIQPDQDKYAWLSFLISVVLFTPVLVLAAIFIRPIGWPPLWIKWIPENMLYVYFACTAPLSFMLNILVFGVLSLFGMYTNKDSLEKKFAFTQLFSTSMYSMTLIVILDFIVETIAIIYFLISKNNVFPPMLIIFMFFMYGMMFLWEIVLLTISFKIVTDCKMWYSVIAGIVSSLLYWFLMAIWIA